MRIPVRAAHPSSRLPATFRLRRRLLFLDTLQEFFGGLVLPPLTPREFSFGPDELSAERFRQHRLRELGQVRLGLLVPGLETVDEREHPLDSTDNFLLPLERQYIPRRRTARDCAQHRQHGLGFPAEHGRTPLAHGNYSRRHVKPTLDRLNIKGVTFQVLRRSCASLLNGLGIDGKLVADQPGYTLDVSQNVYTKVAIGRQEEAINQLDTALNTASNASPANLQ